MTTWSDERARQFMIALRMFLTEMRIRTPPAPAFYHHAPSDHVCTRSCSMFNHGDFYLCRASGNLHECSEFSCRDAIVTPEHVVCTITGRIRDLALRAERDAFWRTGPMKRAKPERSRDAPKIEKVMHEVMGRLSSVLHFAVNDHSAAPRRNIALHSEIARCTEAAVALWTALDGHPDRASMRHDMFCLVVIYWAECGYQFPVNSQTICIIPPLGTLAKHLPFRRDIGRASGMNDWQRL